MCCSAFLLVVIKLSNMEIIMKLSNMEIIMLSIGVMLDFRVVYKGLDDFFRKGHYQMKGLSGGMEMLFWKTL